ncbi:CRTAC1 family protein [Tranquillimonas rosea]|uniref:CRTAC1 family protein n=1 Tax=Tranquillimonas rosea TaxID=641238 RepID=UPI003BAD961C
MRGVAVLLLTAGPALAGGPVFEDASAVLPHHVYSGGWEHFVGGGVAVFDCSGDGRPEIFAAGGAAPAQLFRNISEQGTLAFETAEIPELTGVTGAWPIDLDGDGPLDLVVLRAGPNVILRGTGDCHFEDATDRFGLAPRDDWSTAFAATWEEGRELPTLAIGNYVDRDDPEGPFGTCDDNLLYRGDGARYEAPEILSPGYCALSMLISDWARTGRRDLRISNDRHYYVSGGYEQMWRLDEMRELGDESGWDKVSIWGMGIASRDITGDGRPEVMLTSMGDQLLQIAEPGGTYAAAPYEIGTYAQRPFVGDDGRPSTGWHAEWGDVNNDGRSDLFIAKGNVDQMPSNAARDPNNLLIQGADGTFVEAAAEAGVAATERARGAALADFDRDGRLDLVVVNRRAPMELYRNAGAAGGWLQLSLSAPPPNTRAVGAWIELRLPDGSVQAREVTVGGGHGGGQAGPHHFGLGAAEEVDLRIIQPDGRATEWVQVEAGQRLEAVLGPDNLSLTPAD